MATGRCLPQYHVPRALSRSFSCDRSPRADAPHARAHLALAEHASGDARACMLAMSRTCTLERGAERTRGAGAGADDPLRPDAASDAAGSVPHAGAGRDAGGAGPRWRVGLGGFCIRPSPGNSFLRPPSLYQGVRIVPALHQICSEPRTRSCRPERWQQRRAPWIACPARTLAPHRCRSELAAGASGSVRLPRPPSGIVCSEERRVAAGIQWAGAPRGLLRRRAVPPPHGLPRPCSYQPPLEPSPPALWATVSQARAHPRGMGAGLPGEPAGEPGAGQLGRRAGRLARPSPRAPPRAAGLPARGECAAARFVKSLA